VDATPANNHHHLCFNGSLTGEPGTAGFLFSSSICTRKEPFETSGTSVLRVGCTFLSSSQQYQAPTSTNGLALSFPPPQDSRSEGALLPIHQFSNASTINTEI